jgi:hypothetical protein
MSEAITLERVQQLVTRGPYHQWLGHGVIRNNPLIANEFYLRMKAIASL